MIVELGAGILAIGALGYAIHWQRRQARWARIPRWVRIREERVKKLKWLGNHIDSLWNEIHREELRRLKRLKRRKIEGGRVR